MKDDYDLSQLKQISVRGLLYNVMPRYVYHYIDNDYETFSLDLLDRLVPKDGIVVDIGAHYGVYSLLSAHKAKKVYAFEPVPENFEILNKNIVANKLSKVIFPTNLAVSDVKGTAEFNMPWASDSAGFYDHPNAKSVRTITVKTNTIDSQLDQVDKVDFVKIDTEGHELHVLEGMRTTILKNQKSIKMLIEFNPECLMRAGARPDELISKIDELGFDIFAIHERKRLMIRVLKGMSEAEILKGETYLNFLCLPKGTWTSALFLSHSSNIGGAELALYELIEALINQNETFFIPHILVSGDGAITERFQKLPVGLSMVPMPWWVSGSNTNDKGPSTDELILSIDATREIINIAQNFKPRTAYTNTLVVPWLAVAARMCGIPHVWSIHEFGDLDHEFKFRYGYDKTLKLIDDYSDAIIVNSDAVKNHIAKHINKNSPQRLYQYIRTPDVTKHVKHKPFSAEATLKLIITGRVAATKGQFDAIRAVKILHDEGVAVELAVVGSLDDDYYVQQIRDFIQQYSLEKVVKLHGFQANPADFVSQADIALTCSQNEALGRVTIEAMLLRKPVVGAKSGGTAEVIDDGRTGYLYKQDDIQDLATKIRQLQSATIRKRLGDAGFERATSLFTGKYYHDILAILSTVGHDAIPGKFYSDLATGLKLQGEMQQLQLNEVKTNAQKELEAFSTEYNKVYAAYNELELRLQKLTSSKLYKAASHMRRYTKGRK